VGLRILIAEDDNTSRFMLKRLLERLGHECIEADNGLDAWRLFNTSQPDVVISDWMMPGHTGLEFCRLVRAAQMERYTYFVVLTALDDRAHAIEALEVGADDYLVKPLDRDQLQARLIVAARFTALQAQIALKNRELERLNRELYEDGRRDPLTRIGNRLRMQEDLEAMAGRARRYGHTFCVALCDIDFFKLFNDSQGHAAGDETIRAVARTLVRYGREGDSAYRYGGEEFLVLLPEQELDGAVAAMDRRRVAVEALGIAHPRRGPNGLVTISGGVAVFDPTEVRAVDALLRRADAALYLAKGGGRNQIVSEREVPPMEPLEPATSSLSPHSLPAVAGASALAPGGPTIRLSATALGGSTASLPVRPSVSAPAA
jgi:diguanylate cyclase (GGDEF)-like protein